MAGVIALPARMPRVKDYVRCCVCREKLRKGDEEHAGDHAYNVDSRILCEDCGLAYWASHYPDMELDKFDVRFREVM